MLKTLEVNPHLRNEDQFKDEFM